MAMTIELEVFRYRPDDSDEGTFQTFEVPYEDDWLVLTGLNYIKNQVDGTLSYRFSCQMGVCGSCGMVVNGTPLLTCATYLKDFAPGPVRIEPLANFPVIRDLVTDVEPFMRSLEKVKPWLIRKEEKPIEEGEYKQTPGQLADFKQYTLCINCMLCYSACPVYGREPEFIGPAAIALAQRWSKDSRDEGAEERAEIVGSHEGIWACTFVGDCTKVCPAHVDPAAAIQEGKVLHTQSFFKSLLMPGGKR